MTSSTGGHISIEIARRMAGDLAEYSQSPSESGEPTSDLLPPQDDLLAEYDRRIVDSDLRVATRSRFVSKHYADAVEAGVKALNESVRARAGRNEDGDGLMTIVFSPKAPLLRVNAGRSKSDESEQRGHMHLCQGVVGAWRNPRAHSIVNDSPVRTLMMLEAIDSLISITKAAVRSRRRKN